MILLKRIRQSANLGKVAILPPCPSLNKGSHRVYMLV